MSTLSACVRVRVCVCVKESLRVLMESENGRKYQVNVGKRDCLETHFKRRSKNAKKLERTQSLQRDRTFRILTSDQ